MDKLKLYIALTELKGIGRRTVKGFIDKYGDIHKFFEILSDNKDPQIAIDRKLLTELENSKSRIYSRADQIIEQIENNEYRVYLYGEPDYPGLLGEINDPPAILYCEGEIEESDYNAIAVVGTRKASQYGKKAAEKIASALASHDITVVSGCAKGIDTQAHNSALKVCGRTVAVLGSGLLNRYPDSNIDLMERIKENGALISEFSPDTKPLPYNFPMRNRIISGLSLATVVIEAPEKSGALITAVLSAEQGREVFSVPGNIFAENSKGTNDLIKDGAIIVTDENEIIEMMKEKFNHKFKKDRNIRFLNGSISDDAAKVFKIISEKPTTIDELKIKSDIKIEKICSVVTELEMLKRVRKRKGNIIEKNE